MPFVRDISLKYIVICNINEWELGYIVLSTFFGETFFSGRFILNGSIDLTSSYPKPFVVSVPELCFQIFTVKFLAKNGSELVIFYSKLDFYKIFIILEFRKSDVSPA